LLCLSPRKQRKREKSKTSALLTAIPTALLAAATLLELNPGLKVKLTLAAANEPDSRNAAAAQRAAALRGERREEEEEGIFSFFFWECVVSSPLVVVV